MFIPRQIPRASHLTLCTLFAAVLTACGGGTTDSGASASVSADTSGRATALSVSAATPTTLATEGNTFTVTGTQTVSYGAGSNWITQSVTGTGTCSNAFFGNDPAPGTVKSCTIAATVAATPAPTTTNTTLTTEGNTFTVTGTQAVKYGAGSNWITQSVTGTGSCTNLFFGSDPAPGTPKSCVLVASAGTVAAPVTSILAPEGGTFTVSGTQVVSYGAGASWIQQSVTGTGTCSNAFFGSDPAYGTVKSCMLATTTAAVQAIPNVTAWVRVGLEGDAVAVTGTQNLRFGDGVNWATLSVSAATTCSVGVFGSDPAPGTQKFCEVQKTVPGVTQVAGGDAGGQHRASARRRRPLHRDPCAP